MVSLAPLKGLVLAGGSSRRMGRDKAGLEVAGQRLLDRAIAALTPLVREVHVSVRVLAYGDDPRAGYRQIADAAGMAGPGGGILSAHLCDPSAAWLVVACDMPLLDSELLQSLLDARGAAVEAVAWRAGAGGAEPLCALYEPVTLAAFLAHVAAGGNASPRDWLATRPVALLEQPAGSRLSGANTPGEFDRLRAVVTAHAQDREP